MDFEKDNIVIEDSLDGLFAEKTSSYVGHFFCYEGSCKVVFNNTELLFNKGNCMIAVVPQLITKVEPSDGFKVKGIYTSHPFLESCAPRNNHAIQGTLGLYFNPIWDLTPQEQQRCKTNFQIVEERFLDTSHAFYWDLMVSVVQTMFLDFYNFQVRIYGSSKVPEDRAFLMKRFMQMLEQGEYRHHREVAYFASELFVTPKYLSEVVKKTSGFSANYWISRFVTIEINRMLKDRSITLTQIADKFKFSSLAAFSRYVKNNLGIPPSAFRE